MSSERLKTGMDRFLARLAAEDRRQKPHTGRSSGAKFGIVAMNDGLNETDFGMIDEHRQALPDHRNTA
jgi:hypothetical protein